MKPIKAAGNRSTESGFTLIEMLISLGLFAIVLVGISAAYIQTLEVIAASKNHIQAINYAQNAGVWIVRDGEQAKTVISDDPTTPTVTEVLTISWDLSSFGGAKHTIRYARSGTNMTRSDNGGTPVVIASGIKTAADFTMTKVTEPDNSVYYKITVKSTIGSYQARNASLVFYFKPRLI